MVHSIRRILVVSLLGFPLPWLLHPHVSAALKGEAKMHWMTYQSNILHARMTVPASWVAKKAPNALAFHTPGNNVARAGVGLMRSAHPDLGIERSADMQIALEGEQGWSKSPARVAGRRAIKIIGSPKNNPDMKMVQYYIDDSGGTLLLQCIAPTNAWPLYSELFSRIISTLQLS